MGMSLQDLKAANIAKQDEVEQPEVEVTEALDDLTEQSG